MSSEFTAEFFRANREKLRTLFTGTAPIVLTANGLMQRSTDTAYPFKQDSSFWYLTGIDEPNIVLVMDRAREYLIVPELSPTRVAFDGAIDVNKLIATSGISDVTNEKEGWKRLETRLKKVTNLAVVSPAPAYIETIGMYTNPARARLSKDIKSINPDLTLLDLRQHIGRMRMVKGPEELATLKKSIDTTVKALQKVHRKFVKKQYSNEYEIELDLTREFWRKGASGHSFEPIVAAGKKAATIHPTGNNGEVVYDEPLLLDVGAEHNHYAADISRTWMIQPTKRFGAVYNSVKEVADYAMSILKPGVIIRDYEKQVESHMGEKLRELGLIKTIDHDSVRQYFPHATSHFLGIDVHDVGDYDRPLEPGVVMTVEPGIYIPEEGIGVRIEDDVLITQKGSKNLSGNLVR
ncbi:MAG: Xaa-Pro peptidase family protein [Patescibacteria group bacterium]